MVVANISVCTMFRRTAPGTRCDSAFNVPSENGDLKMKQRWRTGEERCSTRYIPYRAISGTRQRLWMLTGKGRFQRTGVLMDVEPVFSGPQ